MPHHSKQDQQQGQQQMTGAYATGSNGHLHSQQSFPPPDARSSVDYPSGMSVPSSMSMPPGNDQFQRTHNTTMHWMAPANAAVKAERSDMSYHQSLYHRVPTSPPDATDLKNRTPEQGSKDEQDSKSYERIPSREIASVLLLAAAASSDKEMALAAAAAQKDEGNQDTEAIESTSTNSSRPLKKRKNFVDILRKKSDEGPEPGDACHVSPMSHSSKSITAVTTGETRSPCDDTRSSSTSLSYEMKEDGSGKTGLDDSKKSAGSANAQLPAHVMIPHFPSALHWILTECSSQSASPDFVVNHTVMQWVSHGQAWRVVRWDAFHRQVLPTFFPQLSVDGDGRQFATGSIDAFLWHLAAWGFEEIKDGPDVGSFAHTLFRRGHPQLCREMRFSPKSEAKKTSSSVDSRSLLRVPSLTSTSGSTDTRPTATSEYENDASAVLDANLHARSSSIVMDVTGSTMRHHSFVAHGGSGWATSPSSMRQMQGPPIFVNYRPEEMNLTAEGWTFGATNQAPRQWMGGHPATPPQQLGIRTLNMPPYSPIRIRSARGARRLSLSSNSSLHSRPSNETPSRGFPVSNRGMGRRNVAATAVSSKSNSGSNDEVVMLAMLAKTETQTVPEMDASAEMHAEVKLPRSVLKRKLPLMSATVERSHSAGD